MAAGQSDAKPGLPAAQADGLLDWLSGEWPLPQADVQALLRLAQRLATRRLYGDAVAVLRAIQRLDRKAPEVAALLRQIEPLAQRRPRSAGADDRIDDTQRRDAIDASHFLGLAALYADRNAPSAALECLEMAKQKLPVLPYPYKLHGRLLWRQKDYDGAARELAKAVRFNPFDAEAAELMGLVEYERKNFEQALRHTVDAYLLLREEESRVVVRLRRRVRTVRQLLDWDSRRVSRLFHDRQQRLATAFDRLQWQRDLFLVERGLLDRGLLFTSRRFHEGGSRIALSGRLREAAQLRPLSDETIFQLTEATSEETVPAHHVLFAQGSRGRDIYLLERGDMLVRRQTPYGDFALARLHGRELFGEVNYVDQRGRSAEAVSLTPCSLLRLDADSLDSLVAQRPPLGVQIFSALWRALAARLRSSNHRLASFLPASGATPRAVERTRGGRAVNVSNDDKVRLFREQGLSSRELLELATFSKERRYAAETFIFREGDLGDEMYFVLDGCVRISKFLSGTGEEALAILGRGEFFGEMSLIDGQPRSADARTHSGAATLLALDRDRVAGVLSMEPEAALTFLRLLCRILAARLREQEEKLVLWQILSFHDPERGGGTGGAE
ncbi:MAG TPA: cyclic nucleotide-binding domain-containing protein [Thermoanaerobaculia bacterium]|nr:cyclic nucleotide-binding domain-containing protein [Thermoanaerobaculia bacterium]